MTRIRLLSAALAAARLASIPARPARVPVHVLTLAFGLVAVLAAADHADAQFVAEQVTPGNAATDLFAGTDADGGVDDWYLSNGVVEAIIDDVGSQVVPMGVTPPPKQSEAAFTGGSIIDLGVAGADDDQLTQIFTVGGLSTSNFILYDSISASTTAASATITATGNLLGFDPDAPPSDLPVVTEYTVAGNDNFFTVTTTVTNNGVNPAAGLGGFLDAAIWTLRAVVPFSPLPNRGFNHAELDFDNLIAALEQPIYAAGPGNVGPEDGVMDTATGKNAGEVSYGFLGVSVSVDQDGPGGNPPVVTPVNKLFGISSNLLTGLGNFPAAGSLMPGGVLVYTRRIYVGARNDVASVANDMLTEVGGRLGFSTGTLAGDVDAADTPDVEASVVATRTSGPAIAGLANGSPTTHFRTNADGSFSGIVLPVGTYDLEFRSVERDPATVTGIVVAASTDTPVVVPALTPTFGTLEVRIMERKRGYNPIIPGRLTFKGVDGTDDPLFGRDFEAYTIAAGNVLVDLNPETFGGGSAQHNFVYLKDASTQIQLKPGVYEIFASRGPEYTVRRKKLRVKPGKTRRKRFSIRRVVETPDAISADFHVHSGRSLDASAPLTDRVISFAGEDVEVMIATDHDCHTDYAPVIADLHLGDAIKSLIGDEVTGSVPNPPAFPQSFGHINAWPLPLDATAGRDGAIEDEFVAPNLLFSRLRNLGAEVVQYNHPRAGVSGLTIIGFFNNIGYDPTLPITSAPNDILLDDDVIGPGLSGVANPDGFRNIDFDTMEILNEVAIEPYLEVRRDWFSLLNQTDGTTVPFIPGTAVSDSHRITMETAGYGRSYVLGVGDDPASLNVSVFDANVKAGKMVGTSGPYIELSMHDGGGTTVGLGETLVPSSSQVTLSIRVQSTNWIPVEEVRIYRNGFLEQVFDATTTPAVRPGPRKPWSQRRKVVRFDADVSFDLTEDSWFVVEAGSALSPFPSPPEFVDRIVPGMVPVAFTNPVFVDLGGDGFDPPGLPVMAAPFLAPQPRIPEGAPPTLGGLTARKRQEVMEHFPFWRLTLPLPDEES